MPLCINHSCFFLQPIATRRSKCCRSYPNPVKSYPKSCQELSTILSRVIQNPVKSYPQSCQELSKSCRSYRIQKEVSLSVLRRAASKQTKNRKVHQQKNRSEPREWPGLESRRYDNGGSEAMILDLFRLSAAEMRSLFSVFTCLSGFVRLTLLRQWLQ